jgi:hypothetical protein
MKSGKGAKGRTKECDSDLCFVFAGTNTRMTRIIKSEYIPEKSNLKSFYRPTKHSVNKFDEGSEHKNTFPFA